MQTQISVKNTIGLKPFQSDVEQVIYLINEMIDYASNPANRINLSDHFALTQLSKKLRDLQWLGEADALLILRSYDFLAGSGFKTDLKF